MRLASSQAVLPIGGLLLKNGALAPSNFVLVVILAMGLITPVIGCMKFTDDLAKVGTIISQVTDILTAPELSPTRSCRNAGGAAAGLPNVSDHVERTHCVPRLCRRRCRPCLRS